MIDIDLLFAEGYTSAAPELRLPHPYLHERAFVLVPLYEIESGLIVQEKRIDEWLERSSDAKVCRKRFRAPSL